MQLKTIFRVIGILLMVFSISMLPPAIISLHLQNSYWQPFVTSFGLTFSVGFLCWLPLRHCQQELKTRDGFVIVVLFWTVLSLFGALPLMLSVRPHLDLTNAMFETVSGLTTTGGTVLSGLDTLPSSILYYRQQLQFLGGMGIIVLAVAVLPMLGIGGMQLYRAETPGPMKDTKLTPRITETAKALWYIYVGMTAFCIIAFWASGMTLFEAVGDSFGTVSTGGFAMHDSSFSYYHSSLIEIIAAFFMLISATNFSLHFRALQDFDFSVYWKDQEFRVYVSILLAITLISTVTIYVHHIYKTPDISFVQSLFNVISLATTTGFTSGHFDLWPSFLPYLMVLAGLIGGCAASTSGGVKVIRLLILHKQSVREIQRLIHPRAILTLKLGKRTLPEHLVQAIWGFMGMFFVLFVILFLMLLATGLEPTTAFGALAASISNTGAGIGGIASGYAFVSITGKWLLIFAMLAGRLEIFTLLVLFSPSFWRY